MCGVFWLANCFSSVSVEAGSDSANADDQALIEQPLACIHGQRLGSSAYPKTERKANSKVVAHILSEDADDQMEESIRARHGQYTMSSNGWIDNVGC